MFDDDKSVTDNPYVLLVLTLDGLRWGLLYSRALAVTDGNWLALNNQGAFFDGSGQRRQAVAYFREALRITPDYAGARGCGRRKSLSV